MMLAVSLQFSPFMAKTIFLVLLTHKAYEAVSISSIVLARSQKKFFLIFGAIYTAMFPLGVLLTFFAESLLRGSLSPDAFQKAALFIMSLSLGGLLGCLVFDFLLPSWGRLKERPSSFAWLALGLVLTLTVMRFIGG